MLVTPKDFLGLDVHGKRFQGLFPLISSTKCLSVFVLCVFYSIKIVPLPLEKTNSIDEVRLLYKFIWKQKQPANFNTLNTI